VAALWEAWGVDHLERQLVDIRYDDDSVVVLTNFVTSVGIIVPHRATYTREMEDVVGVVEDVEVPRVLADLARIGTVLEVVPELERFEWFGSGPHETYPDRKRGGLIGRWSSTVTEQHVPYIRPQESGGHADVRWLQLSYPRKSGLRLEMDAPRQVSVTHFRAVDLAAATHDDELRAATHTVVHVDVAHRGLGTGSCGPDALPEYRIRPGRLRWAWTLRPIK
jgi:beta-galactosidase